MIWKDAMWLGLPASEVKKWNILEGDMTGRFTYFRCDVEITQKADLILNVTANSRYRLWVNDSPVLSGPCKGDTHRHYYETVDVSEYLVIGQNVLAVQVLYCDPDASIDQLQERSSIFGVVTPRGGHRLAVEGTVFSKEKEEIHTVTTGKAIWKAYLDGSYYLKSNEITINMGAICEEIDFRKQPTGYKYHRSIADWQEAKVLEPVLKSDFMKYAGIMERFPLCEREIPLMYEKEDTFVTEFTQTHLLEQGKLMIPANRSMEILLDAGAIKNGYLKYCMEGGNGRKISFTYFEKFINNQKKIKRSDWENGEIVGLTDEIILEGSAVCYEPFWYRTFRFLRIQVDAGEEDMTLKAPIYKKTSYPLVNESWVKSSAAWIEDVWKLCVRTLENCMMETYMDCPYYEQMQFPMDTRLQAMFNYAVSKDVRLARKALKDYHYALLPIGLIPGKYPSAYCQIISTFSLHYIYMLHEYYIQTKDVETIKEYRTDVDIILSYYDRRIGEDGLVGNLDYWEFVDWQKAWTDNFGVPAARKHGPSTIINLMYAYALLCGAKLNEVTGRIGIAKEYDERRQEILSRIQKLCWDEEAGMYREGPSIYQFSQHAQSWAILNDMEDMERGRRILKNAINGVAAIEGCEAVIPCSFSTAYEWFRALEKMQLYVETKENMMRWVRLLELDCTTCPEEPEQGRSDCHAWSALPMYEMIRSMAGICCDKAGWESVVVHPHLDYLPDLSGEAATPKGLIGFSYKKVDGVWEYQVDLPEGLSGTFIYPDGKYVVLEEGRNYIGCLKP